MKAHRVAAVLLHSWYHVHRSMETWVDLFLNSAVQMAVFALIAQAISEGNSQAGVVMVIGMLFWNIIWVSQYAIPMGALWEIWSFSFSTLFITPLTLNEFLVGQMISSVVKAVAAYVVCAIVASLAFSFDIWRFGWWTVPYFVILMVFGWGMGMAVMSLVFRKGTEVQSLSWFLVFLVQPVGGIFYPVSILPPWLRPVSYIFPSTYVFDVIRKQYLGQSFDSMNLVYGGLLSIAWFLFGYALITWSFSTSKRDGLLARMLS